MITKTLIGHSITTKKFEQDLSSLRRLLAAAAIDQSYCQFLLNTPVEAIKAGYGGEEFPMSPMVLDVLAAVRANTLLEFIYSINEKIPIL